MALDTGVAWMPCWFALPRCACFLLLGARGHNFCLKNIVFSCASTQCQAASGSLQNLQGLPLEPGFSLCQYRRVCPSVSDACCRALFVCVITCVACPAGCGGLWDGGVPSGLAMRRHGRYVDTGQIAASPCMADYWWAVPSVGMMGLL
jgi:hypothetical protein